jgi:hypothetical protein
MYRSTTILSTFPVIDSSTIAVLLLVLFNTIFSAAFKFPAVDLNPSVTVSFPAATVAVFPDLLSSRFFKISLLLKVKL